MNRLFIFICLSLSLVACHPKNASNAANSASNNIKKDSAEGDLVIPGFYKKQIELNHSKLTGTTGDFTSFKKYLKTLDTNLLAAPYVLDYIKTCLHLTDTLLRDSVFLYYHVEFNNVIRKLSDSVITQYDYTIKAIDTGLKSPDALAFTDNLNQCGIEYVENEVDGDYIQIKPEYLYDNFKNYVTKDICKYLQFTDIETKEGYSVDGGLSITFDQLYQRIKRWEKFANTYPHSLYRKTAIANYNMYMNTLICGMDNSPVYDYDSSYALLPEIKTLYQKIMKDDTASRTTKIITVYYDSIAAHNFNRNDSVITQLTRKYKLDEIMNMPSLR